MNQTVNSPPLPYLDQIRVSNHSLPLYHAHWEGLVGHGFHIRQILSRPFPEGLNITLSQYENTQRGTETLRYMVLNQEFTREKLVGVREWANRICQIINFTIKGYKPIEELRLCICRKTGFLVYYGSFMADQMEIIIYIGSRENIDGATVTKRHRSQVDLETRDWKLLSEYLPEVIIIEKEAQ